MSSCYEICGGVDRAKIAKTCGIGVKMAEMYRAFAVRKKPLLILLRTVTSSQRRSFFAPMGSHAVDGESLYDAGWCRFV